MSLNERNRSSLYHGLKTVIADEEAIDEMLSPFPARDLDEHVSKDHLRAELAVLDAKLTASLASVDQRMTIGFAAAQAERSALEQRMVDRHVVLESWISAEMRKWFLATIGAVIGLNGLTTGLILSQLGG